MSENAKKLQHTVATTSPVSNTKWNNRILVVEDEPGIASSYKDILEANSNVVPMIRSSRGSAQSVSTQTQVISFKVTICSNALEGLTEAKRAFDQGQPYALGFFDVKLGEGMDGIELVKEIQKFDPEIYAVFVTAYNDRSIESIHKFLGEEKANRWDYLNKPFFEGEVYQKARNFVSLWNLQKDTVEKNKHITNLQKKLFDSEKLTAVSAVARGVTHEFGNILLSIMGRADMSRNQSQDQMKIAMDKILEACSRATDILDKFKSLSEPSGVESKKEMVSINKIIDDAIDLLEHRFKTANIKICKIKNDSVTANVHATPILQVVVNLSINAMHAMPHSGQIDYSLSNNGDDFEIIIRDYGTGIPQELMQKVLEPFFTTKGKQGTGLGLSICKEIVEIEHQGKFILRNHNVKGLEIVIQIPKNLKG